MTNPLPSEHESRVNIQGVRNFPWISRSIQL